MTITVTDHHQTATNIARVYRYRAELRDDHNISLGLGYGATPNEAAEDAAQDYRDRIEGDIRVAMRQFEAQEA